MGKKEKKYSDGLEDCSKSDLIDMIRNYGGYKRFVEKNKIAIRVANHFWQLRKARGLATKERRKLLFAGEQYDSEEIYKKYEKKFVTESFEDLIGG